MDLDWEKEVRDLSFLMKAFGDGHTATDLNTDLFVARAMCLVCFRAPFPIVLTYPAQQLF
jgi:hypothetical protein